MTIKEIKISELKEYENNPRINDNAVDKVVASIENFGFRVPIVIDKDNITKQNYLYELEYKQSV